MRPPQKDFNFVITHAKNTADEIGVLFTQID